MDGMRICSVCGATSPAFAPGPDGRADAACPACSSLERHRFLLLLLRILAPRVVGPGFALEVAPDRFVTRALRKHGRVVRTDLAPRNRRVDVAADLTRLPFSDGSARLIVCYHVLEHIPDDAAAMRELARVLAPGGLAFVQVPVRVGVPTEEDPEASPEERTRRFGQRDHVRYYGDQDFEDRLARAGLRSRTILLRDVVPPWMFEICRLDRGERVWLCSRADAAEPEVLRHLDTVWTAIPHQLTQVMGARAQRSERQLVAMRARYVKLKKRHRARRRAQRAADHRRAEPALGAGWRSQVGRVRRRISR